ncbi:MAG: hypothetical protein ACRYG7_47345 [Janthinobacterium lividum]
MPFAPLSLYFENAAGQVREHPAGYAVICYSLGKRQPETFEALAVQLGRLLLLRGWHRLLSDQREMTPLSEAEKTWITDEWLTGKIRRPAALWEAVLVPVDVFARLSVGQILNQTTAAAGTITLQSFTEEAAAHAYLLSVSNKPPR